MYTQLGMDSLKKRFLGCDLHQGDNAPSMKARWTSHTGFCDIIYRKFQMWPTNPSSVTYVNHEILTNRLRYLPTKIKDLSYTSQKFLNHSEKCPKKSTVGLPPVFGCVNDTDNLQDWDVIDNPNSIKIRNDANLLFLLNSEDIDKDNSTMESHSTPFNEMEKLMKEYKTDTSGPSDVDCKSEVDIHKDIDVESFHVISHSDVPVNFAEKNTMSRFLNVCRNAFISLANHLYCKSELAKMSVNHPCYLTKPRHRRKANTIAMGRGRGRAKCQLRRSGVSQTVCRKECIKEDYEAWQNDRLLNSKFDDLNNVEIPDPAQVTKQMNSPLISSASKATSTREKPKVRQKKRGKRTKAKYMTKVRCIAKSSRMNNREVADEQEDSSYFETSSEYDVEDDWIVFDDEDEKMPEIREKRGATEYPIRACYVPSSSMKKDSSYENFNSEIRDEWMECPRMHHYSRRMKISDEHCEDFNSQMRKDSPQHRRLEVLSESSDETSFETSDDSNVSNFDNCSFTIEENDNVNDNKMNFYDRDSEDDCIMFAAENSEKSTAQTKKVSFDPTPIVHTMVKWNYAYRAARRGPWEEIARDNERFRGRINSIAIVLDPILKSTHRSQVWQERFAFSE